MPNMSNKNFPHAHGAGRVIAAFQLSHPGAGSNSIQAPYSPGAEQMKVLPPVLATPALGSVFPYPDLSASGGDSTWGIYRQPHNATSIGVYVQGSGTRRLPYTESLLPDVPDYVSVPISQQIPTTGLYPFSLVDDTALGRTHAQVVCSAVGVAPSCGGPPDEITGAGQTAYYEVGLNCDLPDLYFTVEAGLPEVISNLSWANQHLASVQRALERTFWASASVTSNALSEWHPAGNYAPFNSAYGNVLDGPVDGSVTSPTAPFFVAPGTGGMASPYGFSPILTSQVDSPVQPAYAPMGTDVDNEFRTRTYGIQTQVSALMTAWEAEATGPTTSKIRLKIAPIVRVWVMQPASAVAEGVAAEYWAPLPIPRSGLGAYMNELTTSVIPSISVQVVQKNSSATDGTDGPIYDLGDWWEELGTGPGDPVSAKMSRRTATPPRLPSREDDR